MTPAFHLQTCDRIALAYFSTRWTSNPITNFVVTPLLVAVLVQFLPSDPMVRLGVLQVLLTPCIDYVVTFSHLGCADARLLLAATPTLLVVQMLLLPVYLGLLLGNDAATLVQPGPFVHAFVWLIAVPLALAGLVQLWAARSRAGEKASAALGLLPVPATALVLLWSSRPWCRSSAPRPRRPWV